MPHRGGGWGNWCCAARPSSDSDTGCDEERCGSGHSHPGEPRPESPWSDVSDVILRCAAGCDVELRYGGLAGGLDRGPHLIARCRGRAIVIARCVPDDLVDAVFFT